MTRRLARWLHAAWLRWHITSTEQYIAACKRDGIFGTDTLRHWQAQLDAYRVRLALVEGAR